jgi:hypothetical protein
VDEDALGMSECADSCGATWNANSVGTATKMSLTRMKSPTVDEVQLIENVFRGSRRAIPQIST